MIIRRAGLRMARENGREWLYYSDEGGLTQFGAYVDTLQPGATSSEKHWHEQEDEFLYVLDGELTVIEDDVETVLHPGDSACWPAGEPVAHTVANRSAEACSYLIVGTRVTHDACHYPDSGQTLYTEGEQWRIENADGDVLKTGRCKSPPGRD
ncbi:MAG: cupin domain-containing protein [Woeseiaceae bacterium]|nr:cupin domain-containing protein [Woeseiaceae bacterium]